jgi:hypothetical protein
MKGIRAIFMGNQPGPPQSRFYPDICFSRIMKRLGAFLVIINNKNKKEKEGESENCHNLTLLLLMGPPHNCKSSPERHNFRN